ncbi:helix-turn-helix domain-containing protein [Actinoplanes sp. G11-F43]|uniref:helix-turn-helix domain-containing protein n=1 Tax=Actinoplanes sp. G11-F43 TaxID=3424130 RepID=UPI003D3428E6
MGSVVARDRLRSRLLELRRASGLTPGAVTARTHWSLSKLSRIEAGAVTVAPLDAQALARIYGVADQREILELTEMAVAARRRHWWSGFQIEPELRDLVAYESAADRITVFGALLVPDLVQTEAYATAALTVACGRKPDAVGVPQSVDLILRRQSELAARLREARPPRVQVVLDGAVLQRRIGGGRVMREQLGRLEELAGDGRMRIVVVPLRHGVMPGPAGAFELLEFAGVTDPDVVFVDGPGRGRLLREREETAAFHEMAGLLAESGLTGDAAIREMRR